MAAVRRGSPPASGRAGASGDRVALGRAPPLHHCKRAYIGAISVPAPVLRTIIESRTGVGSVRVT
jgi:hypothetical protein